MKPAAAARDIGERMRLAYARVHETSMRDVPICNPALEVAAVGFRALGAYAFGVVVTPWFMNFALSPLSPERGAVSRCGHTCAVRLPAGVFDFLGAELEQFGALWTCSLFSPMHDFRDQASALATARAALDAALTEPAAPARDAPSRRLFLRRLAPGGASA